MRELAGRDTWRIVQLDRSHDPLQGAAWGASAATPGRGAEVATKGAGSAKGHPMLHRPLLRRGRCGALNAPRGSRTGGEGSRGLTAAATVDRDRLVRTFLDTRAGHRRRYRRQVSCGDILQSDSNDFREPDWRWCDSGQSVTPASKATHWPNGPNCSGNSTSRQRGYAL